MSPKPPTPDQLIDQWVRDLLARREQAVDGEAVMARVRARMADTVAAPRQVQHSSRWQRLRYAGVRLAVAAAILLAVVSTLQLQVKPASAETLVRQALQQEQDLTADRCYVIDAVWTGRGEREVMIPTPKSSRLWTRGDRFLVETPLRKEPAAGGQSKHVLRWGRGENGQLWFALSPQLGFRFDPAEIKNSAGIGTKLLASCELFAMNTETLLRDVLAAYHLQREPAQTMQDGHRVEVVHATVKPAFQHRPVHKARIEIDAKSKVVRRAVIFRKSSTITFALVEILAKPDSYYQLTTHLSPEGRRLLEVQEAFVRRFVAHQGQAFRLKALDEGLKRHR